MELGKPFHIELIVVAASRVSCDDEEEATRGYELDAMCCPEGAQLGPATEFAIT